MMSSASVMASSPHGRALMWLGAMVAATALWLGVNTLFPALSPTGIPTTVLRVILHSLMLGGLWLAVQRSAIAPERRMLAWLAIALPFTLWLAVVWTLAVAGVFIPAPGAIPIVPLAIFLPVIVGAIVLTRSHTIGILLDAIPSTWLIALQAYRVFGGIFLLGWARGELASAFALPAGTGDMIVGLLALPVAIYLAAGARAGRSLGIAWNILGMIDLAVAVLMGMLTAPGPLQVIVPDRPNALLMAYPTVMIPAFAVPSSILLHVLSLRQLRRMRRTRLTLSWRERG
jgi:hypothetical protein